MKEDVIPTPIVIDENEIKFDAPESWETNSTVVLKRNPDRSYTWRNERSVYNVVRAVTDEAVWLIGNSSKEGGKGIFIIRLPKAAK